MRWIGDALGDVRYTARQMRRAPAFAAIAVATLAIGIGSTTAIFSVVNAVLLTPLPYRDSKRLVYIVQNAASSVASSTGAAAQSLAALDASQFTAFRSHVQTLSHVVALGITSLTLTGQGEAVRLDGAQVSPDAFAMLDQHPLLGRPFQRGEDVAGADSVVILSHVLWRRQFGGDRAIVGRVITLDGKGRTVIGVMSPQFAFPDPQTQFWVPYVIAAPQSGRSARIPVIARLKDGVSMDAAGAEVNMLLRRLGAGSVPPPPSMGTGTRTASEPRISAATESDTDRPHFEVISVEQHLTGPAKPAIVMLMMAVAFVLLIACVNVANLLLARAVARRQEIAMRLTLGASQNRLLRQLMTESITLALIGGVVGIAMAVVGIQILRYLGTTLGRRDLDVTFSIPRLDDVGVDTHVLIFTLAVSIGTGVLFGVVPALRQARGRPMESFRQGAASAASGFDLWRSNGAQGLLVIAEIGMAMLLFVASGLLMRSFVNLSDVNPGYDSANVLTFQLTLPDDRNLAGVAENLVARLRVLPSVRTAAYTRQLPLARARSLVPLRTSPELPTQAAPPPAPAGTVNPPEWPDARHISQDYLDVMRIPIVAGRGFDARDSAGQQQVLLINETLAGSGLLGPNPVGRYVYALGIAPWEVIGIVTDVRQSGLDHEPGPQVFIDMRQLPGATRLTGRMYFVVRTDGDPTAVTPTVRSLARQLDPLATIDNIATMDQLATNSIARPRFYTVVLAIFAAIAIVLAVVGIYGVGAYVVTQRTREIGIRMALGAQRGDVMRLVLGQSGVLILCGLTVGLGGAVMMTRYLRGMLFGVTPLDPPTFVAVAVLLGAVATFASYMPARRASRVNPLMAIRYE